MPSPSSSQHESFVHTFHHFSIQFSFIVNITTSNPPAGRTTCTHNQIIAENAAITARNDIHLARRNKGKANIDNDEPLIPVPPIPPVIFSNANATNANTLSLSPSNPTPSSSNPTTSSSQSTAPSPVPNPTNMNVNTMISALANLSPTKLAKIHASIFNTTSPSSITTASSLLSSTAPSAPSITAPTSSDRALERF
ncbi:hypothetical protein F4604DRAFT_2023917 [Suillus subluteus]|nr:hypothetical protein F4604DRAFT_2023917 [Suillus subluteus]